MLRPLEQGPPQGWRCSWEPLGTEGSCRPVGRARERRGQKFSHAQGPESARLKPRRSCRAWPGARAPEFGLVRVQGPERRRRARTRERGGRVAEKRRGAREPGDGPERRFHRGCRRARAQLAASGARSRAARACLFLSLEVAHFHFLVHFGFCVGSVCKRACARTVRALAPRAARRGRGSPTAGAKSPSALRPKGA